MIENYYIYTLVNDVSAAAYTEAMKVWIDNTVMCAPRFDALTFIPGHRVDGVYNYMDIEFRLGDTALPDTAIFEVELPTSDGRVSLYYQCFNYSAGNPVDCDFPLGLGAADQSGVVCTVTCGDNNNDSSPLSVKVTGIGNALTANSSNVLRLVGFQNPSNWYFNWDGLNNSDVPVYPTGTLKIYSWDSDGSRYQMYGGIDYRLYVQDGADSIGSQTNFNDVSWSSSDLLTYTSVEAPKELSFTMNFSNDMAASTESHIIFQFDAGFSFPSTASGNMIMNCSCDNGCSACTARQYYLRKIVIVSIDAASGVVSGATTFKFVSLVAGDFTTPHYDANQAMSAYAIDGTDHSTPNRFDYSLAAVTASTPTTVTIENLYTKLNRNTFDYWKFTISPIRDSTYLQRVYIEFPSEFQWVNVTCTSFTGVDMEDTRYPYTCTSDCSTETCSKQINLEGI